MLSLALDTSGSTLSVALLLEQKILAKNTILENSKQAELLICEIEKILQENNVWYQDLDFIATTHGPGSFTGVRVALTVARIIKIALNLPLILVNSCEAIAYKYKKKSGKIFVILDAKADEFFIAEFFAKDDKLIEIKPSSLIKLEEISQNFSQDYGFLCGSGKEIAKNLMVGNFEISLEEDVVDAQNVGLIAYEKFKNNQFSNDLNPLYLRMPKIEKRKK